MATHVRPPGNSLVERLIAQPQGFNLFQAISLLERSTETSVPVGRSHRLSEREAVRLCAHVSLAFEPSDVKSVTAHSDSGEAFTLFTSVLSLAGAGGPLPLPFTELLLERKAHRDKATADFLDIFNHRFLSFLFQAKKKHSIALGVNASTQSSLATTLDAISALGLKQQSQSRRPPTVRLRHAGLLAGMPRSMSGLLTLLRDRLGVEVHGTQFCGGWQSLEPNTFTRLGSAGDARATRLSDQTVLGRRVWDQGSGISLLFSQLSLERMQRLLPGADEHTLTDRLVHRYFSREIDVQIGLQLAPSEHRPCLLSAKHPMRLGWTAWLASSNTGGVMSTVKTKLGSWKLPPNLN